MQSLGPAHHWHDSKYHASSSNQHTRTLDPRGRTAEMVFCIYVVHVFCVFLNIRCTVKDVLSITLCLHRSWRENTCLLEWSRIRNLLWLYSCHSQHSAAFRNSSHSTHQQQQQQHQKKIWLFHQFLFLDLFFFFVSAVLGKC